MPSLPRLMTCRQIMEETGLPESTVLRIMRRCDLVRPSGVRRVFVRRSDVERVLSLDGRY